MATELKLPDLGENIESGNVTKLLVSKGDTIKEDQPVIEIETDKAVVEVPSTVAGKVTEIRAAAGKPIKVGETILVVSGDGAAAASETDKPAEKPQKEKPSPRKEEEPADKEAEAPDAEAEPAPEDEKEEAESEERAPAKSSEKRPAATPKKSSEETAAVQRRGGPIPAAPSVRRLAREIGIDIFEVEGTGSGGRITEEDVKSFARSVNVDVHGMAPRAQAPATPLPDFSRWGDTDREAMSGVRRRTAENMSEAWTTVPHVTQFDKADVTDLEALRKKYGPMVEKAGGKLTVTAILLKVLGAALKKFPQFNASIDVENSEIIYKHFCNIGVAVDTDRGLLVPVVRDVNSKNVIEIAVELSEIAAKARNRKLTLEDMQGGTFTISNLGGIGGTAFTPIVYAPQVAILGVARAQIEPVLIDGEFRPRTMLPLALSYDHRLIDGADGARFARWVAEALEQPFLLFLEG